MSTTALQIPIAKPCFFGDEGQAIQDVLNSGWVSQGPTVQRFERALCDCTGSPYAVAATSWTTAFHLAFLIYGIGTGDDVLCPSYSFIATANVVRYVGATPRFVDIDPKTLNLCPVLTEAYIQEHYQSNTDGHWHHKQTSNRLKAIELVHQIGIPADIDGFKALGQRYNCQIFEDSACAIGSTYKGQPIGSSGLVGAFSFHPRKTLTTGEGGMLLLPDEDKAIQAGQLRTHGMSISDLARHGQKSTVFEQYDQLGYNYKMTDIQAALGLSQLSHLDEMLDKRIAIAQQYDAAFANIEGLSIIQAPDYVTRWNVQSYPIRLVGASIEQRSQFMERLQERGVSSRRGIPPAHREPLYCNSEASAAMALPNTETVSAESLFIPIYPSMTETEVAHVIDSVQATANALRLV